MAKGLPACGMGGGCPPPCMPRLDIKATSLLCGRGTMRGSCGETGTWKSTGHTR